MLVVSIVIDSSVASYFQRYIHIRPFAVYIVGIEDFFASAFKNMAFAAQLTSSSSVTINFVEYRLHSAQPSKLDSALVCTIFRHNPNKFGFCSRCSICSQLCKHFHSFKTESKRSSRVDDSIFGAVFIVGFIQSSSLNVPTNTMHNDETFKQQFCYMVEMSFDVWCCITAFNRH